ncbi:hypothetical protein DFH28DRAFT_1077924 [Melampsora americana]|nr:hypothetical protein DFH28DRAFT_1077924 [Melampsora americana]
MCSAAAFHFTLDLIKTISIKYQNDKASWEVARQIWTTETLLPFVYFILTCNPNLRLWKRIKVLTAAILKNYHSWSIEENTISNQEKLANFILWQTEVTYHILKMSPNVRSSQESEMKSTSEIMVQKLSTLARIFYVIHTDDALEAFMASPTSCRRILKRHVSETFEGDYKLGYPTSGSNQDQHGSVWERWKTKSAEITRIAQDVQWPSFQNPVQSGSEPVLFMNGEIENEIVINKDPQVSQFIQKWESEFMHTMRLVKPWQSKNLIFTSITLKDISHGIHRFSKDWFPKRRKIYDLAGKCKYEVTLLSIFLQQDSQDKMFSDFWKYFAVVESQRTTDSKKRKKLFV